MRHLTKYLSVGIAGMIAASLIWRTASTTIVAALRRTSNVIVEGENEKEAVLSPATRAAHEAALKQGSETYLDPETNLTVFTRQAHINRGRCCGSFCRHCPYGHINVPQKVRATTEVQSAPQKQSPTTDKDGGGHHATVYTRTGDAGTSALFTGERKTKSDVTFEALGTVDELNSFIGLASSELTNDNTELSEFLSWLQQRLLDVGTIVATPGGGSVTSTYQPQQWVLLVEQKIDAIDANLPPLTSFILPGGSRAAATLHVCRSVTRRAERCLIAASESDPRLATELFHGAQRFMNRLSDFFFVAARSVSSQPDRKRETS